MKERNLEGGKRKAKVESLNNHSVHQKIMRRIRINYSGEIPNVYRFYNDITFPSGAG
jgi:hypothetical protein